MNNFKSFLNALSYFGFVFGFFIVMAQQSYWCLVAIILAWLSGFGVTYFWRERYYNGKLIDYQDKLTQSYKVENERSGEIYSLEKKIEEMVSEYASNLEQTSKFYEDTIKKLKNPIVEDSIVTPVVEVLSKNESIKKKKFNKVKK